MVTKLKRFKIVISFIAFLAGISLLLGSILDLTGGIITEEGKLHFRYSLNSYDQIWKGDYQNTAYFRQYISSRLETFLGMATGAPVMGDGYDWYGPVDTVNEYNNIDINDIREYERTLNNLQTALNEYRYAMENYGYSAVGEYSQYFKKEVEDIISNLQDDFGAENTEASSKKRADRLHLYMEKDKNLLYAISYDGELLYTNGDNVLKYAGTGGLPEGYNFCLYFDGSKVKVVKDGQEIDVYGDGYYRDSSDWYVPGYKNFTLGEGMEKAKICILAAKAPVWYSYSGYDSSVYRRCDNELYWMAYNFQEEEKQLRRDLLGLGVGLLLMLIYALMHRSKREADRILTGLTKRLWLEVKVIAVVLIIGMIFSYPAAELSTSAISGTATVAYDSDELPDTASYTVAQEVAKETSRIPDSFSEAYVIGQGQDSGRLLRMFMEMLRSVFEDPLLVILLFWLLYFAVLDTWKNRPLWKCSLIYKLLCLYRAKDRKLPITKKLIRREAITAAICILAALVGTSGWVLIGTTYRLGAVPVIMALGLVFVTLGVQYMNLNHTNRLGKDLELLEQRTASIRRGEYLGKGEFPKDSDLAAVAYDLEDIGQGMEHAIEEQVKSQRMKVELIANVSHDIKTPLTSIISYVQFLKQETGLPEHVADYIRILDEKSQRLKNMVQDVFDVSKAASGDLPVYKEVLDFCKLLRQTLADMEEQLKNSPVTMKIEIPDHPVMIEADGQKLYRVFQNLILNALQYSLEGSRIYLTLKVKDSMAVASVKNTSRYEIAADKDYTERFIRGDESRTDGGSGLGLSIARNFTEASGGEFQLETIADLFVVTVAFHTIDNSVNRIEE